MFAELNSQNYSFYDIGKELAHNNIIKKNKLYKINDCVEQFATRIQNNIQLNGFFIKKHILSQISDENLRNKICM